LNDYKPHPSRTQTLKKTTSLIRKGLKICRAEIGTGKTEPRPSFAKQNLIKNQEAN
jgi:hypothetical protein